MDVVVAGGEWTDNHANTGGGVFAVIGGGNVSVINVLTLGNNSVTAGPGGAVRNFESIP